MPVACWPCSWLIVIFSLLVSATRSLYLAVLFVLFLGLQVNSVYGNVGLVAVGVLVALYVYLGFVRR